MKIYVAVYGSLRMGLGNHFTLDGSVHVGDGKAYGYRMYPYMGTSFPSIARCESDEEGAVTVEVYEIDDEMLERLDLLEGFDPDRPNCFYKRILTEVTFYNGDTYEAYIYVMDEDKASRNRTLKPIESGDWLVYLQGKFFRRNVFYERNYRG